MSSSNVRDVYKLTLQHIYNNKLIGRHSNSGGFWCHAFEQNIDIWRISWAFDTLIDYMEIFQEVPQGCSQVSLVDELVSYGLDASKGSWWDDYGWLGVAALRAAERKHLFPHLHQTFFKVALNAWCYMFGCGWKVGTSTSDPWTSFAVPFPSELGWEKLLQQTGGDIGAPNVYEHIKGSPGSTEYAPAFTPGGVWNSPIDAATGAVPKTSHHYCGHGHGLSPIQNTVTNAIYTLLSLRMYKACLNSDFKNLVVEAQVSPSVILKAWEHQLIWFHHWFFDKYGIESTMYQLCPDYSPGHGLALVRERVPIFKCGNWDSVYRKDVAWTGDQGLIVAALHEAEEFLKKSEVHFSNRKQMLQVVAVYKDLLCGVKKYCYAEEIDPSNPSLQLGVFLRPWVEVDSSFGVRYRDFQPEPGDDSDYRTGVGVFYRFLLQLYHTDVDLVRQFKSLVLNEADRVCEPDFPDLNDSDPDREPCDGYLQHGDNQHHPYNNVTPWINRMALLLLAITLRDD